jgi:hypothetical protein
MIADSCPRSTRILPHRPFGGKEILIKTPKNKGARGNPGGQGVRSHDTSAQKLSDLGVSFDESSRFLEIASIPEPEFEERVEETKAAGKPLTTSGDPPSRRRDGRSTG